MVRLTWHGNPVGVRRDFDALEGRRFAALRLLRQGLNQADVARIEQHLLAGPERLGYETSLWTSERVAELIRKEFGVSYHPGHMWKLLVSLGWSCQRPTGRALERNESAIRHWKKATWPDIKKAQNERRTIVFLDESGLS